MTSARNLLFLFLASCILNSQCLTYADTLVPKKGKRMEGAIVSKEDGNVVFNVYWSRNSGVTNPEHIVKLPEAQCKHIERTPRPHVEVYRRLERAKTADDFAAIGAYAAEHKLKKHASMAFALALAKEPKHAMALNGIGGASKWKAARDGHPALDHDLGDMRRKYITIDDPKERVALAAKMRKAGGVEKLHELERLRRSALQPTGYQVDRKLCIQAPEHPLGMYSFFVPDDYTPTETWPLIIGLHGGGSGGKAGDEVVGSGQSAMSFYRRHATDRGFLVACPNALSRGWGSKDNEQLVRDVMSEVTRLYNIDLDRIYLTGHSMGGFGTWTLGPRMAEHFAAISPMAGAGSGVSQLISTQTPIFIFHSADDFIDVSSDRTAAKQLKASPLDFVYTEFPNAGHGFPSSVQVELFDFFAPRRLYLKRRKSVWPRSSLLGKVTPLETRFLGDPLAETRGDVPSQKALIKKLALGGGCAEAAFGPLLNPDFEGTAASVSTVLQKRGGSISARTCAARLLAKLGDAETALPSLRRVMGEKPARELSHVVRATAESVAQLERNVVKADADEVDGGHSISQIEHAIHLWTDFYKSKLKGGAIDAPDWQRVVPVLANLVSSWAVCARDEDATKSLVRTVFDEVIKPGHRVAVSPRVPEDPSLERSMLAAALARAYARGGASEDTWNALFSALSPDERAVTAARAAREQVPARK